MPRKLRPGTYIGLSRSINFMGFDFLAESEVRVTDFGQGPTGLSGPPEFSDPGWGPEYDVEEIILHLDDAKRLGPGFRTDGALFDHLCKVFDDAIAEAIPEHEPEPDWMDEDYYRGDR